MVESGIIKIYFGSKSHNKKRFGFINVIDENNKPTGEEVFFHRNQARQLEVVIKPHGRGRMIAFSTAGASLSYLQGEPRAGDRVVFEARPGSPKRRVTAWMQDVVWAECASELFWSDMDALDSSDFDPLCPGECAQTTSNCSCAELDSLRCHNSMTDGYWTA